MLLFLGSHLTARRTVQPIAMASPHDCPPIGPTTVALKEDNGSFDEPKGGARLELRDLSMDTTH